MNKIFTCKFKIFIVKFELFDKMYNYSKLNTANIKIDDKYTNIVEKSKAFCNEWIKI